MQATQDIEQKIADVYKRIQAERGVIQASQRMRQATGNQDVQRTLDRKIREAESSISYFQETLDQLKAKKTQIERRDSGGSAPGAGVRPGDARDPRGQPGRKSRPETRIQASVVLICIIFD